MYISNSCLIPHTCYSYSSMLSFASCTDGVHSLTPSLRKYYTTRRTTREAGRHFFETLKKAKKFRISSTYEPVSQSFISLCINTDRIKSFFIIHSPKSKFNFYYDCFSSMSNFFRISVCPDTELYKSSIVIHNEDFITD